MRLPIRGGNWNNAGNAGLAALNLNNARSNRNWNIGFRPALGMRQKASRPWLRVQRAIKRAVYPRPSAETSTGVMSARVYGERSAAPPLSRQP